MGLFIRFIIVILFLSFLLFLLVASKKSTELPQTLQPIKIMAVGDSITAGHAGDYTWRYRLWQHLKASQVSFDFVGPKTIVLDTTTGKETHDYLEPLFDQDHDGAWGRQLDSAKGSLIDEMRQTNPDVLLVHLGTNDILARRSPTAMIMDMRELIGNARLMNPKTKLVLSLLTPRTVEVTEYNKQLTLLASQVATKESPVVIADPSDFDPKVDTYDGTHPTPSGEFKLARGFATALASLGIGKQPSVPIPSVPAWPPPPTMVTITATDGGAKLTWQRVAGAGRYQVAFRNVTKKEAFRLLSSPVNGTTIFKKDLLSGETYEFAVSTIRGTSTGPLSKPIKMKIQSISNLSL